MSKIIIPISHSFFISFLHYFYTSTITLLMKALQHNGFSFLTLFTISYLASFLQTLNFFPNNMTFGSYVRYNKHMEIVFLFNRMQVLLQQGG